jgi:hypothetical protein
MSGKQAKILAANHIDDLLLFAETTRYPARDRVFVLLSVKAGLRAVEIEKPDLGYGARPRRRRCTSLELRDSAATMGHSRMIPLHSDLRAALTAVNRTANCEQLVVLSERATRCKREASSSGSAALISLSALTAAHHTLAVGHLLRRPLGLCTTPEGHYVMCSCLRDTNQFRPPSDTLMVTAMPNAA